MFILLTVRHEPVFRQARCSCKMSRIQNFKQRDSHRKLSNGHGKVCKNYGNVFILKYVGTLRLISNHLGRICHLCWFMKGAIKRPDSTPVTSGGATQSIDSFENNRIFLVRYASLYVTGQGPFFN